MKIREGDYVILYSNIKKRYWLVKADPNKTFSTDLGNINLKELVGREYGDTVVTHLGKPLTTFPPGPREYSMKGRRPTQIIYPKDIGYIIHTLGVRHNTRFLEIGTGSGALTISVAWILSKEGRITTYESREEFRRQAMENIGRIKPECEIEYRGRFPDDKLEKDYYDVAFIDIDTPWEVLDRVHASLIPGGRIGILVPTYNQLEKLHDSFHKHFIQYETVETMIRNIQFKKGRLRPDFRMIGYTAILVFGIKKRLSS